jgi:hypothetical protein
LSRAARTASAGALLTGMGGGVFDPSVICMVITLWLIAR